MTLLRHTFPPLEARWVQDARELARLEPEWEALCERCRWTTPFQRPDWLLSVARYRNQGRLWVLAVYGAERLVGLAPLVLEEERSGLRTVGLLGSGLSDYLGVLAEPDWEEQVWQRLLWELERRTAEWDLCDWRDVSVREPWLDVRLPQGWSRRVAVQDICPAFHVGREMAPPAAPLPMRNEVRAGRAPTPTGIESALEVVASPDAEAPADLLGLLDQPELQWTRQGRAQALGDGTVRSFYHEVCRRFAKRGKLVLVKLCHGSRSVAVLHGFREKEETYLHLSGTDPRHAAVRLAPAALDRVRALLIEGVGGEAACLRGRDVHRYAWGANDCHTAHMRLWRDGGGRGTCVRSRAEALPSRRERS